MPLEDWASAQVEITQMLDLLEAEKGSYLIVEDVGTEEIDGMVERVPKENGEGDVVKVRGSLIGLVERLDEEVSLLRLFFLLRKWELGVAS